MAVYYKKVLSDGKTLLKYIPNPVHIGWSRDKNENIDPYLQDGFKEISEDEYIDIEVKLVAENFKTKLTEEIEQGANLDNTYDKRLRLSGSKKSPSGIEYADIVKQIYPKSFFVKKEVIEEVKPIEVVLEQPIQDKPKRGNPNFGRK